MPFFRPVKDFKNVDCVSLQVHKSENYLKKSSYCRRKRAYLFTFKGSITIEAAIVTTLFMLVVLLVMSFMIIIGTSMSMQININNIVKSSAKRAFYLQIVDEISEYNKSISDIKNKIKEKLADADEVEEFSNKRGIDVVYLMAQLAACTKQGEFYSDYLVGGIAGINITESSIDNGHIDMVVQYSMRVPFVNKDILISQRAFMKDWTGSDITKKPTLVYITKTGKVYHRTKECRHLNFDIKKLTYGQTFTLRNSSGGKYKKCHLCGNNKISSSFIVYVTADGDRYHTTLDCKSLTRNIITIDISDIGERKACSDCGGGN